MTSQRRAAPYAVLLVLILLLATPLITQDTTFDTTPILNRISAYRIQGRPMQALYQIEALAGQIGWTAALQRQAGDMWAQVGDLTTAAAYWEAARLADPDNIALVRQLAETYLELQHWPQAVASLQQLTALAPDDAWAHYYLGIVLAASDPPQALIHLNAAPDSPVVGELRAILSGNDAKSMPLRVGLALAGYDLWPYAELAFEHAAASSTPAVALAYLGFSRDQQGKDGGGFIAQAVELDPQNPQVRWLQGLHLRTLGDYPGSLNALAQAVSYDPENPAFVAELGSAFRLTGDLVQAAYWLNVAVALSDNAPEFEDLLAQFYAEEAASLSKAGIDYLGESSAERPDDPDLKAGYGWALYVSGDSEGGLAQIDAALELDPQNPRALFYKARMLIETGQTADAIPFLRQVAALESDFSDEAGRILQNLGLTR